MCYANDWFTIHNPWCLVTSVQDRINFGPFHSSMYLRQQSFVCCIVFTNPTLSAFCMYSLFVILLCVHRYLGRDMCRKSYRGVDWFSRAVLALCENVKEKKESYAGGTHPPASIKEKQPIGLKCRMSNPPWSQGKEKKKKHMKRESPASN